MTKKKIGILIVNYNGRKFLQSCLESALNTAQLEVEREVYLVDNNSTDSSAEFVKQNFPAVIIIPSSTNLGFAGGNNLGWNHISKNSDCDYIFLLNQDARLTDNCLSTLANYLDSHPSCAAAQPKLLLWPDTTKLNSLGNVIQYLGFGYTSFNQELDQGQVVKPQVINFCSGAAVMIRPKAVLALGGLFADFMFMYQEDLDFGWRLTLAGWDNMVVPQAIAYHEYEFNRSLKQYYYFERNRLWVIAQNYRLGTLLVLLPAIIFMELGQLFFAAKNRTLLAKLKSYWWLLQPRNIRNLVQAHQRVGRRRKRSDRYLLGTFSGQILFQPLDSWLLRYCANPIFSLYLSLIRLIIIW